jgi:hypothetical protein
MRVATGIIAIVLSLVVGAQALLVTGLSNMANDEQSAGEGGVGVFVAILLFLGGAFAFGLPQVSIVLLLIAGVLGLAVSANYGDLAVWGVASLILAAMAFFGWRGKRRADRRAAIERQADIDRAVAAGVAAATGTRPVDSGP